MIFNYDIAMDLKMFSLSMNVYFINFINLFTRFSKVKVMRSIEPKVIMEPFITTWIAERMGTPNKISVENGAIQY